MYSWLFTPAHDERKSQKALASKANVIILDWEDSVPAAFKPQARQNTSSWLTEAINKPIVIRINAENSPFFSEDLEAVRGLPLFGVMVSKVSSPESLKAVAAANQHPIPLVESAFALENLPYLLKSVPAIRWLAFGTLDYLADIGGNSNDNTDALIYPRSRLVNVARANGLEGAIDGVFPDLNDMEKFMRDACKAKSYGFKGKLIIHPKQIEPTAMAFRPTDAELEWAQKIIAASENASRGGKGAFSFEGRLVDAPVIHAAERLLADHAASKESAK